jgi:hypothetical protein
MASAPVDSGAKDQIGVKKRSRVSGQIRRDGDTIFDITFDIAGLVPTIEGGSASRIVDLTFWFGTY